MNTHQFYNDFTLEELEDIQHLIKRELEDNHNAIPQDKLLEKIEQMIKNYCDHEFEQAHIEIEMEYCKKCGIQAT